MAKQVVWTKAQERHAAEIREGVHLLIRQQYGVYPEGEVDFSRSPQSYQRPTERDDRGNPTAYEEMTQEDVDEYFNHVLVVALKQVRLV